MKISVAMAYYNGGMYIEEQMDTILTQLGEQDEERTERHDTQDNDGGVSDHTALLESFRETESVFRRFTCSRSQHFNQHQNFLSENR